MLDIYINNAQIGLQYFEFVVCCSNCWHFSSVRDQIGICTDSTHSKVTEVKRNYACKFFELSIFTASECNVILLNLPELELERLEQVVVVDDCTQSKVTDYLIHT